MTEDVVVEPMTEEFILGRCLHDGPLSRDTINQWPSASTLPWARYREMKTRRLFIAAGFFVAQLTGGTTVMAEEGVRLMNLKQPPLNTTMTGVLKGVSDYHGLNLSEPMIYGLSGHAFLINIHVQLCPSGPYCWKLCWNDEMFFWDRFADEPDPDPERYLRNDYETVDGAIKAMGYGNEIVANSDCIRPEESPAIARHEGRQAIRGLVLDSIREGRPVIATLISSTP